MNKKMSRIAAIALSAAMVTSAFAMSTSASFAATRPTATKNIELNLKQEYTTIVKVNNSGTAFALPTNAAFDWENAKVDGATKDLRTLETTYDASTKITSVAKSGDSVSYDADDLTAPLTAVKAGDTTFTYTVKLPDTADNIDYVATVKGTVKVVPSNTLAVVEKSTGTGAGSDLSGVFTVSTGATDDAGFVLRNLGTNTANYESVSTTAYQNSSATYTWATSNASVLSVAKNATNYAAGYKANTAGTSTVSATVTGDDNRQILPLAVTVEDSTNISASASTDVTIAPDPYNTAKTYITGDTTGTVTKSDVTGKDITLDATNMTGLTVAAGAKVGKIVIKNAPAAFVALNVKGTTGNITFDSTSSTAVPVTAVGAGATTGTIDLSEVAAPGTTTVALAAADTSNISVAGVALPTGSTLTVENKASKAYTVALGAVTADTVNVTGETTASRKVSVSTLTATDSALTTGVALTANDVALNVATSGKLASLATTGESKSSAISVGSNVAITALTSAKSLDTFTFAKGATIGTVTTAVDVDADGKKIDTVVSAPVNSLSIGSNSTGEIAVKLTGAFKAGDSWVTTAAKANVNLSGTFTAGKIAPSNFDSATSDSAKATSTGYSFFVTGSTVTGVALDKSTATLGLNDSTTLTLQNQPAGAADYAKYTVAWTTSNPDFVTVSGSGKTATVTAVKYAQFPAQSTDNAATITATYVAYDNAGVAYTIGTATCAVTVTPYTAPVLTTKVQNLGDTEAKAVTADTVIKMTQSTYATVDFSADKAGITAADLKYGTGSDKVAQTGTYDPWNGTAGKYYIYANGKVGDKVGVYANGQKIFQVEIVDRPFTSDTTVDFDLKAGSKYQFKITPNADTTIKDFTFNTANDAALSTWGFTKNADGTVTATVKANKAGKYGVYCDINGVKYKVFAVTVK